MEFVFDHFLWVIEKVVGMDDHQNAWAFFRRFPESDLDRNKGFDPSQNHYNSPGTDLKNDLKGSLRSFPELIHR